ncbi:MAG: YceD family protein [Thermoleophilia bacterium]
MRRFNVRSLSFGERSEAQRRLFCDVAPFSLGGIDYEVAGGGIDLDLVVSQVGRRMTLRGDGVAVVRGPCQRCLEEAELKVPVPCVEYLAGGESVAGDDEAYVRGYVLDLERWVRDGLAEALPPQILCREDCRGLCAVCGANLNEAGAGHEH